ncbi:endonuclease VII domain-containing protein [Streptomyces sp. LN549]|uniref:endonuclease VII domain-containing protein n=1 Tax=Streptomyces sp. LN549 TaxID=3112979 RepID=UPI003723C8FF
MRACKKKRTARGLCATHYGQGRRAGTLPPLQLELSLRPTHSLSNADPVAGVADCSICGPRVPIRVGVGRGNECKAKRLERIVQDLRARPRHRKNARKSSRSWRLKQYGLTEERYEAMVSEQGGACRICGYCPDLLVVDHDHKTGEVRGLLCRECNLALGFLRDNPAAATSAAAYLLDT